MTLAAPAPPPSKVIRIGPADDGRPMSLKEFGPIKVQEGFHYELGRGRIEVSDIPRLPHGKQLSALRRQLFRYDDANPGRIRDIFGGGECKITIPTTESERHPDLAVYLSDSPPGDQPWDEWVPEIVVEFVSKSSARRDYGEKAEDYLAAGVREYWIIDRFKQLLTVLARAGDAWDRREYGPDEPHATPLLPGFTLTCGPLFAAAGA